MSGCKSQAYTNITEKCESKIKWSRRWKPPILFWTQYKVFTACKFSTTDKGSFVCQWISDTHVHMYKCTKLRKNVDDTCKYNRLHRISCMQGVGSGIQSLPGLNVICNLFLSCINCQCSPGQLIIQANNYVKDTTCKSRSEKRSFMLNITHIQ